MQTTYQYGDSITMVNSLGLGLRLGNRNTMPYMDYSCFNQLHQETTETATLQLERKERKMHEVILLFDVYRR